MLYIPNNIEFRIVSSQAIAQFKQNQAFDFNEIVRGTSIKFSQESKEILLLYYDIWFKTCIRLERLFVRTKAKNNKVTKELIGHMQLMIDDCLCDIEEVISSTPRVFNTSISRQAINKTNSITYDYLKAEADECFDSQVTIAYPKIINAISDSLHQLLYQLYEIEEIGKGLNRNPFLSYTKTCENIKNVCGVDPILHRAKIYFNLYNIHKFVIKNYTKEEIPKDVIQALKNEDFVIKDIEDIELEK